MFRLQLALLAVLVGCPRPEPPPPPPAPSVLETMNMRYPESPRGDVVDNWHGTAVPDPYRWLEDPDSEATKGWVAAQNDVTHAFLATIPEREAIRERLTEVWNYERYGTPDGEGLPVEKGGRVFLLRYDGVQDQGVIWVADSPDAAPRVLLDPNAMPPGFVLDPESWQPSWNGKYLAYAISDGGSDWRIWRVRDVATGQDLPDEVRWSKFSEASWSVDDAGFWYSAYPAPKNPLEEVMLNQKVYFHRLGTAQADDALVFARPENPEWYSQAETTSDGTTLLLSISESTAEKNRLWLRDLTVPDAPFVPLFDAYDHYYYPRAKEGRSLWVETDNGAPRGRVIRVDLDHPEPENWVVVLPEARETLVKATMAGDTLFAQYLKDARSVVRLYGSDGAPKGEVALPGIGHAAGFEAEGDAAGAYWSYTSFVDPGTLYRYDVASGQSRVYRDTALDVDPERFVVEQVFYESRDGTKVPMFVVRRKDLPLDGERPTLLYGYGGFNAPQHPEFQPQRLVWLEMGGVFALANLRGGGEYGREWHEAGTLDQKQNVFDDFVAAGEWLVDNGYTKPEKLAIQGRSNGGLLVGAVLEQRPDLFGAALPMVGVMDMLRYQNFTIGWAWASDYGVATDPEMFPVLRAYSPVHNARKANYPATLVTTADHDDRVVPGHSYKFTAALQAAQKGPEPILIRIETRAGHGGGSMTPTTVKIAEVADQWAFLVWALEMTPTL